METWTIIKFIGFHFSSIWGWLYVLYTSIHLKDVSYHIHLYRVRSILYRIHTIDLESCKFWPMPVKVQEGSSRKSSTSIWLRGKTLVPFFLKPNMDVHAQNRGFDPSPFINYVTLPQHLLVSRRIVWSKPLRQFFLLRFGVCW